MADHQLSKLTTGMIKPPLNPHTGEYSTLHDKDREPHRSSLQELYNADTHGVYQPEPKGFKPMSNIERDPGLSPFNMDRDELTVEFYKKLQDLKNEHQKTVKMLESLYSEAETRTYQAKNYPTRRIMNGDMSHITQTGVSVERNQRDGVFLTEEVSVSTLDEVEQNQEEESDEESTEDAADEERQAIQYREPTVPVDRISSHRQNERVKQMWDDFDLKAYLPPASVVKIEEAKAKRSRPKSAPVRKKEWSPIITIPKPFNMTLREEKKKEKTHTRSSEEVAKSERERLEKEEFEMRMRVRPRDPPAHTFLPLYEEIMERQEQRSRMNRENASRAIQAMVQPFSFMERERLKEEEKLKLKHAEKHKEKKKLKSMAQFVAKPVPVCVHDPTVAEKMKEEQLYRKIKVKLRSEDLMKSSSLPPRMHSHELIYDERRKMRNRDIKRATKLSFKPETHNMPNFEDLHRRDDLERSTRKMEVETTMTEPFHFRTEALRKKKLAFDEANTKIMDEEENFRNSMKTQKSRKYNSASVSDSIPARMTESSRLRIEETKRAIAKAEEELLELKLKERERKERRKRMAQEVATRTMVAEKDFANSSDYRREKLKQYQKQQKARDEEYQRELKEMNNRLKQRPLLFEQQAQNTARQKAEKRYKEILRNSGLSDDMFDYSAGSRKSKSVEDSRTLDDYSDDEFEISLNQSGHASAPKTASGYDDDDSGSDVEEDIHSMDEEEDSRTSVKKHLDFDV